MAPGASQAIEVDAAFTDHQQLAIEHARPARQLLYRLGDALVPVRQVASIAAVERDILAALHRLQPPAIELGFMQPSIACGQALHRSGAAGLDEG